MGRWTAVAILAAAQFVMVLDSSVMNVSISQIVADLNTTIQGVQGAITLYTLVMAAFMLVGAKLGDIWGRNRVFAIGLAVYGLGSLTTALSPNLAVLLIGWSLVALATLGLLHVFGGPQSFTDFDELDDAGGLLGAVVGEPLEALLATVHVEQGPARSYLARFLFRGDDVFKPVTELSGGER